MKKYGMTAAVCLSLLLCSCSMNTNRRNDSSSGSKKETQELFGIPYEVKHAQLDGSRIIPLKIKDCSGNESEGLLYEDDNVSISYVGADFVFDNDKWQTDYTFTFSVTNKTRSSLRASAVYGVGDTVINSTVFDDWIEPSASQQELKIELNYYSDISLVSSELGDFFISFTVTDPAADFSEQTLAVTGVADILYIEGIEGLKGMYGELEPIVDNDDLRVVQIESVYTPGTGLEQRFFIENKSEDKVIELNYDAIKAPGHESDYFAFITSEVPPGRCQYASGDIYSDVLNEHNFRSMTASYSYWITNQSSWDVVEIEGEHNVYS